MNVHRNIDFRSLRPLPTIAAMSAAIAFSLLMLVAGGGTASTATPRLAGTASANRVLPATGSNIAGVVLLAVAVIGIGAAVLIVIRKRPDVE